MAAAHHLTFDDEFNSYVSSRGQTAEFFGVRTNGGDFQAAFNRSSICGHHQRGQRPPDKEETIIKHPRTEAGFSK